MTTPAPCRPTPEDCRLIHSIADHIWEWAHHIEDPATRGEIKARASDLHAIAEANKPSRAALEPKP